MQERRHLSTDAIRKDFQRDVWCILGLPFDRCSMSEATRWMEDSSAARQANVLSTPNLDWVVMAADDARFKRAVINSDLVVIDGTPILDAARFLGLPFKEKVAGSDLIDHLIRRKDGRPLCLFFFGGINGAAEKAYKVVNDMQSVTRAVGFCDPGVGTTEEMSSQRFIDRINTADSDILLLSVGARKAVEWIEVNQPRLKAGVVSHVGAVVNFVSGYVRRAPGWMQRLGVEWLWRIYQEPALYKRYFKDGIVFLRLLATRILPYKFYLMSRRTDSSPGPVLRSTTEGDRIIIHVSGALSHNADGGARDVFASAAGDPKDVTVNLEGTEFLDNSLLGLLLLLKKHKNLQGKRMTVMNASRQLKAVFYYNLVDGLLNESN